LPRVGTGADLTKHVADSPLEFVLVAPVLIDDSHGRVARAIESALDIVEPNNGCPADSHNSEAPALVTPWMELPLCRHDLDRAPERYLACIHLGDAPPDFVVQGLPGDRLAVRTHVDTLRADKLIVARRQGVRDPPAEGPRNRAVAIGTHGGANIHPTLRCSGPRRRSLAARRGPAKRLTEAPTSQTVTAMSRPGVSLRSAGEAELR
jgi:hypothetical protein